MTNRPTIRYVLLHGAFALCMLLPATGEASRPFHEEERAKTRWFRLLRPRMSDPSAQLAYADQLWDGGRKRGARRQYRALVRYWPSAPEAPHAQYAYARALEYRNRKTRALDEYETLMTRYMGMFPHKKVLERIFDMGEAVMERRRGRFLIFPGFHAPERAIPFFEAVVEYGPRWKRAPEAQMNIARIKNAIDRPEEAVFAYDRVELRYPRSPFVEEAAFGKARALYEIARDYPNDIDSGETALHALGLFIRNHPDSDHVEEARSLLRNQYRELARLNYQKARYYDRIARRPRAAITTYERFLEEFPDTEWSTHAQQRLEILRDKQGDQDEG